MTETPRARHNVIRLSSRLLQLALVALAVASCRNDSPTGPSATPAALRVGIGSGQTAAVGTALATSLTVIVSDAAGKPVSGARVDWDVGVGAGTAAPASSLSNSDGVASTTWTLGTVAGTQRVSAQVGGLTPVVFTATAIAGLAAIIVTTPDRAYLGVGDTIRLRAAARDQFGNEVSAQAINFSTPDAAVATVATTGLVTAVGQGTARIVADAGGKADTVAVSVGPAGASACGPIAARTLALGEVLVPDGDVAGVRACLTAPVGINAEYALTLISTSASFSSVTSLDLFATGNTGPTTAALVAGISDLLLQKALVLGVDAPVTRQASSDIPLRAELARRALERRELTPLVTAARDWHTERQGVAALTTLVDLKVGDAITLNANPNKPCSEPVNRPSRVAAVGEKSIVVADSGNPAGGYSDAEYVSIAATFDTLIFPLDTTAFGAPSNVSGRGKVILFYTRSVNSLTPPSTNSYTIGGFFFARDLYPKTARNGLAACASSNETEMFYLLVPDPDGTVNNNKRSKAEVTTLNLGTIAHEFQHLINSGRRLYVNTTAAPNEETWLDEGLAHTAEELLYYRISGFTTRQNLSLALVSQQSTTFSNYASQNFSRLYSYLINPELNSPYAPNDSLATRGATWNFLRFAAGRQGAGGEAAFYRALVNSTTTGRTNLSNVLGGVTPFADYLRDWTVSLVADDFSTATTAALDVRYVFPAWNFRSIYPGLRFGGGAALGVYPINTRSLASGVPQRFSLAGGTSSYVRFGLPSGRSTLVSFASNGGALPSTMRFAIVRLR